MKLGFSDIYGKNGLLEFAVYFDVTSIKLEDQHLTDIFVDLFTYCIDFEFIFIGSFLRAFVWDSFSGFCDWYVEIGNIMIWIRNENRQAL